MENKGRLKINPRAQMQYLHKKLEQMYRGLLLIVLLIFLQNVSLGQEQEGFPGVRYTYVKAYMLNTKKSTGRPDLDIWKEDRYAFSKMGDGIQLDEDQLKALGKITSQDMSTLHAGLSKCFFPRHGLVFFNDAHEPVASISICFECEKINLFPNTFSGTTEEFDRKKAYKQLQSFNKLISDIGFPIYEKSWEYEKLHENPEYMQEGEAELVNEMFAHRLFKNPPFSFEVKPKVKISRTSRVIERKKEKTDDQGKSYTILEHTFYSSRLEYRMGEAHWELEFLFLQDPGFVFDNGVQIGMSQESFIEKLPNYEGPEHPEKIVVKDPEGEREFTFIFEERTLRRVEGRIKSWKE